MVRKYWVQIKDSVYTALIVGTILIFINHMEAIVNLSITASDVLHWSLNFVVPFMVSLYSRIAALQKIKKVPEIIDA